MEEGKDSCVCRSAELRLLASSGTLYYNNKNGVMPGG